nr:hypothetical protein [Tanacetum cinerariifolium]
DGFVFIYLPLRSHQSKSRGETDYGNRDPEETEKESCREDYTFPPKKLREDYHAATSNIRGKSLATIRGLIPNGSGVSIRVTGPHVVVSMTPTLNDGPIDSISCCGCSRNDVVVTTTVTVNASIVLPPKVRFKSKNLEIFGDFASSGEDLDSKTLHRIYVPKWNVTNDFVLDDPCTLSSMLGLHGRDAKIPHLKSLLSLKEAKAIEAIRLCGQLSIMEAVDAAKGNELRDLKERNFVLEGEKDALSEKVTALEFQLSHDELSSKMASIESERDMLVDQRSLLESVFELFKGRMEAMQDEKATILGNRVAKLDAQLLEMVAHLDEEFYPRFLTAISGRPLVMRLIKARRQLSPWGDFPVLLPSSRKLVGRRVRGEIKKKCSSLTNVLVPLVEPLSSKSLIGEASTSVAPATTEPVATLSMTFASSYVVPPLSISDYQVLDAEPHDEYPHATA